MRHLTLGAMIGRESVPKLDVAFDKRRADLGQRGVWEGPSGQGVGLWGGATCRGTGIRDGEGGRGDGGGEVVHWNDVVETTAVHLLFNICEVQEAKSYITL